MTLRWTPRSAKALQEIHLYLSEHLPALAQPTMLALYQAANSLVEIPFRGRAGSKEGTRELVLPRLPYIIVYRIRGEAVEILYIHHTARNRENL